MTRPAASLLTTLLASLLTSLMASLLVTSLGWRGVRPQGEDDSEQTKEPMRYDEDGRWVFDYDNALPHSARRLALRLGALRWRLRWRARRERSSSLEAALPAARNLTAAAMRSACQRLCLQCKWQVDGKHVRVVDLRDPRLFDADQ